MKNSQKKLYFSIYRTIKGVLGLILRLKTDMIHLAALFLYRVIAPADIGERNSKTA